MYHVRWQQSGCEECTGWLKIKFPLRRKCNVSAISGLILKSFEAA